MQTFIQKKELYTCCTLCTLVSLPPYTFTPYTFTPYTLHFTPLHLTLYTLHLTPLHLYTLNLYTFTPYTFTPYTLPHTPIFNNILLITNFLCKIFAYINYFSYLCARLLWISYFCGNSALKTWLLIHKNTYTCIWAWFLHATHYFHPLRTRTQGAQY